MRRQLGSSYPIRSVQFSKCTSMLNVCAYVSLETTELLNKWFKEMRAEQMATVPEVMF